MPIRSLRLALPTVIGLLALALFGNSLAPLAHAQAHPFKAEAHLTQSVVRPKKDFPVVTTIRNSSGKEQSIVVLICSFPSGWITGNTNVRIDQGACLQSVRETIKLQLGKAYTQTFEVYADLPASRSRQNVTFWLGYPIRGANSNLKSRPLVWTNPLTITVTRNPTATH